MLLIQFIISTARGERVELPLQKSLILEMHVVNVLLFLLLLCMPTINSCAAKSNTSELGEDAGCHSF